MISSCRCDPQLDTEMTAARAHACLLSARDDAVLCCASFCALLCFSLCRSPRVAYRRASARASRSLARRLDRGTQNQQCSARAFLWFLLCVCVFYGLWLSRHTRQSTMRASPSPAGGVWPPALGQPLSDPNASFVPCQVWVPAGSDMRLSFWAPCTFGTCLGGEVRPATTGN